MARSGIWKLLDGYESADSDSKLSTGIGKRFLSLTVSGSITQQMLYRSRRGVRKLLSDFSKRVSYISAKAYGAMSLAFGLLTIILSFLADYGSATGQATTISFIIGVAFALLSIPLLLVDEPLSYVFQNYRFTDKMFFEFFCINRVPKVREPKGISGVVMTAVGVLLALTGYFVPIWWTLLAFFAVVFVVLAFGSPEFSFFATLFVVPYISDMRYGNALLAVLTVLTFVSFIRKVGSGKRVLSFEQYDLVLAIMLLTVLASGIFIKGVDSFLNSLTMTVMTLGYLLAGNLVTNRRLADCMLSSVVISSVAPGIFSVVTFISALFSGEGLKILKSGISSTFAATDICAVFLLVAICFAIALIRQSHGVKRVLSIAVTVLDAVALVLTAEPFAIAALLLGLCFYIALGIRNVWSAVITCVLFVIPYLLIILPFAAFPQVVASLPDSSAISSMFDLWRACLSVFSSNVVFGIGMGAESFVEEMSIYGIASGATNASNLFIELGLEAGVFALLCFVILLVIRIRHRTFYHVYIKQSQISKLSPSVAMAAFVLVCFGTVNYIWSDMSSYFVFWCIFGLGSATLRVAKKEYDDRVMYFEDIIDSDTSVVDIKIV